MQLRKYQSTAIEETMCEIEMFSSENIILEAPTGSGKSVLISELCRRLDGSVVVMVNISPLIEQISLHLDECGIPHSILKAGMEDSYDESQRVQLVMSQTFYARSENLDIECDYLIIDERHREYSTERTNHLEYKLKPKSIIGLTATPYDQAGYELPRAEYIRTISVKDLTEQGFLSPVKYFVPKWSTDLGLEDLRMSGADYSGSAVDEKFNNESYTNNVIASMNMMNAKDKKTLVFCNSIDQSEMITLALKADGYKAEAIHSKKDKNINEEILSSFKHSKGDAVKCLVSVSKLNIGFDVKDVELGVMLRPTKVRSLWIQTVGRLTRIAEGKTHAEFLDLAGTVMEHGFHDELYVPPEYGDKKSKLEAEAKASASHLKHIVSEEPTEINREKVVEFVKELKQKEKSLSELTMQELSAIYEQSDCIATIIEVAFIINKNKTGDTYKQSTVSWISDNWDKHIELDPQFEKRWIKALKSRAKNIVRDGKKLASLYYFIEWLYEKRNDSFY